MKLQSDHISKFQGRVAPRTGAWIETSSATCGENPPAGRPPHGGVD